MMQSSWKSSIAAMLQGRRSANAYRQRRELLPIDSTHVQLDQRRVTNFASNNYLGLTHHLQVLAAFRSAASQAGAGAGAAALVSGYTPLHASAERAISDWKGTESAVLFASGYLANLGAIQTLAAIAGETRVRFLLDKLCHASLIDAVRASGSVFRVFPHNQFSKLDRLLAEGNADITDVVVTESIFSMDGDAADLDGLAQLKTRRPFLLLLDEAHGSGVYGPAGSGYAAELGLQDAVDITVVTLSKAIGVAGGAICASQPFCDAVVNFAPSYIYSTNIPPAIASAVQASLEVMRSEPHRQQRLRSISRHVRDRLKQMGFELPPGDSPIIPIILGSESQALAAADHLLAGGYLTVAIRPPTVAKGSSRLRITLCCDHSDSEIEGLMEKLSEMSPSGRKLDARG